jgi:hypothetical protein
MLSSECSSEELLYVGMNSVHRNEDYSHEKWMSMKSDPVLIVNQQRRHHA